MALEKDFDRWNGIKKSVNVSSVGDVYFYEREVWWVHLGANVGFEQDGTGEKFDRPVVIIKKYNPQVFLAVPLSTTKKQGKYYFRIGEVEGKQATAILDPLLRSSASVPTEQRVCYLHGETSYCEEPQHKLFALPRRPSDQV
ncbi:hypothetical protein HY968_04760, partial [Candidatus Kaiserbacteria bacterium]|nr:hypothetical protein [Candidatus Kaiserbacteria bacterium]